MKRLAFYCAAIFALIGFGQPANAKSDTFITMASTTSTANSGLFAYLLPQFTKETGIEVRVIAVGTGQAVRIARKGDADILFVHHRPSEDKFVKDGYGKKRFDVMYNDFIIVGPENDPANVKNCTTPGEALAAIKKSKNIFASRGDDSGTHKREVAVWEEGGIQKNELKGTWYRSTGSGMGATLNIASGMNAYSLSDRGTWIAFKNKGELSVLCEGHRSLTNPYGVIAVSKKRFPHIKYDEAMALINWMTSPKGQKLIGGFRVNGERLFVPNAN